MNSQTVRDLLHQHVPLLSVDYCFTLWEIQPFAFKTTKTRQSKVGDFTYRPGKIQQITINKELHPYLFLTTYIHEVAHFRVHQFHGSRVLGHGKEWKQAFQDLMEPVLKEEIYPLPLLKVLLKHMVNPKASSFSDSTLTAAFRKYDEKTSRAIFLSTLPEGSIFGLQGKWYKKGKINRTRAVCVELKSKRKYLVPLDLEVSGAQLPLL